MTLIASWIGVDPHGPTSAYIVSDSRITWDNAAYYDYGKKVFASSTYPEIFGYAGDVLFPSTVLSQILEMVDSGVLFTRKMTCEQKNEIVYEKLRYSFTKYPEKVANSPTEIIHLTRETEFSCYPQFHYYQMSMDRNYNWSRKEIDIPRTSGLLCALGSGSLEFKRNYNERYQNGLNASTSRNVFHCFLDTLSNIEDKNCGGAPQLVGIYRKLGSSAKNFGIIYNNRRFFLGLEIPKNASYQNIEWRNERFELCNGESKTRIADAAIQLDPLRRT